MSLSSCDTDIAPTVLQSRVDTEPEYFNNIHGKTFSRHCYFVRML